MSRPPSPTMTRLQRATYRVWLLVGILVLVAVGGSLLYRPITVILAPVLVALLVTYLLNPIVTALEQRRIPRLAGTLLTYLVIGSVIVAGGMLLLPMLGTQLTNFADQAPELGVSLMEQLGGILSAVGLVVDLSEVFDGEVLSERVQEFMAEEENNGAVALLLTGLAGVARGAFALVFGLTVGPVIAFYLLVDLTNFTAMVRRLISPGHRAEVEHVASQLGRVVGGFVRGQLIVATFVGVATSIALRLVGLSFWLVIGVIAGITNLVPLLGPLVAGVLGVTVALVTEGLGLAVIVLVIMTGIQQLESSVVSPLIMGKVVRIHPLAVLVGVLVAAALFGIIGMLVVVPLIAAGKVLASHVWQTRVPWAVPDPDQPEPPGPDPDAPPDTGLELEGARVDTVLGTAEPSRD